MGKTLTDSTIQVAAVIRVFPGTMYFLAALLAATLLLAAACGGDNGDQNRPSGQETGAATPARSSVSAENQEEPGRTPTAEANPTVAPRAGATVAASGRATGTGGLTPEPQKTMMPEPERETAPEPRTDMMLSCAADFRELIAQDKGLVGEWYDLHFRTLDSMLSETDDKFDADYARALNERFMESRQDCVEAGWAPEFADEPVCQGKTLGGNDATNSSFIGYYDGASTIGRTRQGDFVWHPTHAAGRLVLIHFDRMPVRGGPGCWSGNIVDGTWDWQTKSGQEYGRDYPESSGCSLGLAKLAERNYREGWSTDDWLEQASAHIGENLGDCPRQRTYPALEAQDGCPIRNDLGLIDGSRLVLHWDIRKIHPGNPVCWVGSEPPDGSDGLVWEGYDSEGNEVEVNLAPPSRTVAPTVGPAATAVGGSGPTETPAVTAGPVVHAHYSHEVSSCQQGFKDMVAQDRGLDDQSFRLHPRTLNALLEERDDEFDAGYVRALNQRFEAARPDCVALGWDPEFSDSPECQGPYLASLHFSQVRHGFYGEFRDSGSGDFVWNPTSQNRRQVMIHFERMPLRDGPGCWTGDLASGGWLWQLQDASEYGYLPPSSAVCNGHLLTLAERMYRDGWNSEQWLVSAQDYLINNNECPRHRLTPVREATPGCEIQGPTRAVNGELVVHWERRNVYDGVPACWVGKIDESDGGFEWTAYDQNGRQVPLDAPGR